MGRKQREATWAGEHGFMVFTFVAVFLIICAFDKENRQQRKLFYMRRRIVYFHFRTRLQRSGSCNVEKDDETVNKELWSAHDPPQ